MSIETPILDKQVTNFMSEHDESLTRQFLENGYVCLPVSNLDLLNRIRSEIVRLAAQQLKLSIPSDPTDFLNQVGQHVSVAELNALRLSVINGVLATEWFRPSYFQLARDALEVLVGNELVMQRGIGLSIQLPNDTSSLLNVHADSWSGDSPFEVVVWLPLVDCYKTKSMFLLPPGPSESLSERFYEFDGKSNDEFYRALEKDLIFIDIPYGHFLLFNQNLPHGNRVNEEPEARWTMNCRFKSVFSPYADKKLGEFFEPITLRAATRVGMNYKYPKVAS